MSPIFLGMDCGGSSSRAVAVDGAGTLIYQGQSGSANLASTPIFRLRQNLAQATRDCPTPDYICGCFAGLLTEEDRLRACDLLREIFPRAKVDAHPDFAAAYFASEPGTDVCVIAGTGSLICSWDGKRMYKSGGRGFLLGDEGSAFQYGRDALLQFLRKPEEASDALKRSIYALFDSQDEPTIVSRLYRTPSSPAILAKLAKPLGSDAKAGMEYALQSLEKNSAQLARVITSHLLTHFPEKAAVKLCLAGGLWKTSSIFVDSLMNQLSNASKLNVELERIKTPPVFGAVRLAQEMASGN